MTEEWKSSVLQLAYRTTEADDFKFVSLVDMAIGKCDLDTCRILIRTFVTDDDYGVQESVVSALSSARTEDYCLALVEDLPRMVNDAPEWAEVLLEREVKNNPDSLRKALDGVSTSIRAFYASFITSRNLPKIKL